MHFSLFQETPFPKMNWKREFVSFISVKIKIIIFLYTYFFSFDQSFIINIIIQTKTGGKITLFTDRKPRTVDVYYARTLDGKR